MLTTPDPPVWVFAYGSLLWRPGFAVSERVRGFICGWSRRFWQGSIDHRGVPGAPGRVVTLTRAASERCWGVAYRLDESTREAALESLDLREQGGYERHTVPFYCDDPERRGTLDALVYLAGADNPHYLGPAPVQCIAEQVQGAVGPSGANLDYVLLLDAALRQLGISDAHVTELAALLGAPQSSPANRHPSGPEPLNRPHAAP
jgi:glutathione-specific gamma-glutamylcyclotransferase